MIKFLTKFFSLIEGFLVLLLTSLIDFYQKFFSGHLWFCGIKNDHIFFSGCRFYPSCSEYAKISLKKRGILMGILFIVRRILKCNPFSGFGVDEL
mgnify:CR=1 FL=1